jgi:hypothetical protein
MFQTYPNLADQPSLVLGPPPDIFVVQYFYVILHIVYTSMSPKGFVFFFIPRENVDRFQGR